MAKTADYYQLLGVPRNATPDQIRSAYRRLAKQHHPDTGEAPDGAERFKQISEAYEVLSDPERRQRYDMFGVARASATLGSAISSETFFAASSAGASRAGRCAAPICVWRSRSSSSTR